MSQMAEGLSYTHSWYKEKKIQRRLASEGGPPLEAPAIGPGELGTPLPDTNDTLASTSCASRYDDPSMLGTDGGGNTASSLVSVLSVPIREPLTHVV